jgi:hypothetical protein
MLKQCQYAANKQGPQKRKKTEYVHIQCQGPKTAVANENDVRPTPLLSRDVLDSNFQIQPDLEPDF